MLSRFVSIGVIRIHRLAGLSQDYLNIGWCGFWRHAGAFQGSSFAPSGLVDLFVAHPTACAVGCILTPLRGFAWRRVFLLSISDEFQFAIYSLRRACSIWGSMLPPEMMATFSFVLGSWSERKRNPAVATAPLGSATVSGFAASTFIAW